MIIIQLILDILNISQKEFANKIGVSRQTVFMWLSGYRISEKHLNAISEIFNIPLSFLEKSQVSGFQLTSNDRQYLNNCLLNIKQLYDKNIIYNLLKVISSKNYIKSGNFDDFINSNLNYNDIELFDITEFKKIDNNSNYLIIGEINKSNFFDISISIKNINVSKDNCAHIIMNSNEDRITIIKFGGSNETKNWQIIW